MAKEISNPEPAKALPITRTISHPTPTPATLPRALASKAYSAPSKTNMRIRCPLRIPTARAMPNSCSRSAASITKIRKIKSTPAATENCPKSKKMLVKVSPPESAWSMASFLTGSALRSLSFKSGLSASMVASVPAAPSIAGPLWVMRTVLILPSSPTLSCNLCNGMTIEVEEAGLAPLS